MAHRSFLPALLAVCLISGTVLRAQAVDTLVMLHTSDTHLVFDPMNYPPALSRYFTQDRNAVDSLFRFFRNTPRDENVDAVIITGDILAGYEGEATSGRMVAGQIERFRPLYDQCPVPLLLTLGNHDISSYSLRDADSAPVTVQTGAERARAAWIRAIPCFVDGTYYTRAFQVGKVRYHFIFLDDGYSLHDGGRRLDKTQLDWLVDQLQKAGNEPVLLFHHIYFPIGDVNHDGVAFDARKPVDWPDEKQCEEGFLRAINEHQNIKLLVVGHGHENVFEKIRFPGGQSIYQIETGSVTECSTNWRLLRLTEKSIIVSKPGSRQTEVEIDVNGGGQ
jgi:3',5'-cyclic AMP phosphodiesterase CpdA